MTARKQKRDYVAWAAIGFTAAGVVWRIAVHDTRVDDDLVGLAASVPALRKSVDSLAKINDGLRDVMTIEHPETMQRYQDFFR